MMKASVANRETIVAKAMETVKVENAKMLEANQAAETSNAGKLEADSKMKEFKEQTVHFTSEARNFIAEAEKAEQEKEEAEKAYERAVKAKEEAIAEAAEFDQKSITETSRREFLDKATESAKEASASFMAKVETQKEFTATALNEAGKAEEAAKAAAEAEVKATEEWKAANEKYEEFNAQVKEHN